MPKTSPILTNFTAGEFSPLLDGRVDIGRYFNAAQVIENFLIMPFGPVTRRPGTVFIAPVKFPSKKTRLIEFEFSTIQAYIIELGDQYMRFYRNRQAITETSKAITAVTQANPIQVTIVGHGYSVDDEIVITGVVGMTELNGKRFRINTVVDVDNVTLKDLDENVIDSTGFNAYVSGGTAAKIFEVATSYLESELFDIQFAQTADLLYIVHIDHKPRTLARMSDTDWTLSDVVFEGGPFQPTNKDESITVTPSGTTGSITVTSSSGIFNANQVGGFLRIGGNNGHVEITGFNSSTSVDATVKSDLDNTNATDDWALGAFSVDAGFPTAITFHEQRQFLGGTKKQPQNVFGSVTLDFENHTPGSNDTDALNYEIATEKVNAIRWLSSGSGGLGIGTLGAEFLMDSGSETQPLTPSNVRVQRETTRGSELIKPERIGSFLYYVQRGGRKIREFAFNLDIDSFRSLDMTILAEQITESGIVEMAYQQNPFSILWCVRRDGQLACLTREIDQEVIGWSRQIPGATLAGSSKYESIGIIPSGNEDDEVWVIANRTVNGQTKRYVELINDINFGLQEDAFFVDSGLTYSGPAVSTLSGLDHLEGESVQVLSQGAVHPNVTVTNGSITLTAPTTKAHVGLGYTSEVETMRIEGGSATGSAQSKIKRIYETSIRFFKTLGAKVGTRGRLDELQFRKTSDPMGQPPPLFSGDKRLTFPKGYDRQGRVLIRQEQPLPMTILSIMSKLDVFDR